MFSREVLREVAKEEITKSIMSNLDSAIVFTYIQGLEQANQQLKEDLKIKQDDFKCANEEVNKLKEVIEEVRKKLKLERKTALSLNQPYTISVVDSTLQILDKVKEVK